MFSRSRDSSDNIAAMHSPTPRPGGLHPTLRQFMIVVLGIATILAACVHNRNYELLGNRADVVCLNVAFLIAGWPVPWMMILLFLLDRPGPVRNWTVALCLASWGLVAGIAFVTADPLSWALCGRPTIVFPLLPITGLVCLCAAPYSFRPLRPGRCRHCGRRSIIPTATKSATRKVKLMTGWCASCGTEYERKSTEMWRAVTPERADGDGG